MTDANRQIVKKLIREAWTGRDLDVVDELVSDAYVEYAPFGEVRGVQEYKEGIRMFTTAFPDIGLELEDMVSDGDRVAFRLAVSGTHKGPFMGVDGTGNRVRFVAFDFSRLEDGKVVEEWFTMDTLGLMEQIQAKGSRPVSGLGKPQFIDRTRREDRPVPPRPRGS